MCRTSTTTFNSSKMAAWYILHVARLLLLLSIVVVQQLFKACSVCHHGIFEISSKIRYGALDIHTAVQQPPSSHPRLFITITHQLDKSLKRRCTVQKPDGDIIIETLLLDSRCVVANQKTRMQACSAVETRHTEKRLLRTKYKRPTSAQRNTQNMCASKSGPVPPATPARFGTVPAL